VLVDAIVPLELDAVTRNKLLDAADQGVGLLFESLRDGKVTDEELEDLVRELLSTSIDAAIPTGPFDAVDDDLIRGGVEHVYEFVADALERNPDRMRARAQRVRSRGNEARAKRIEDRAAQVAARRALEARLGQP
jgi:hypothetical protein